VPALLAGAAVGVQVGAATVVTRFVVEQCGPATLAFLRYVIALGLLLPFVLRAPRARIERAHRLPIAVLGILQFAVLIALLNLGLRFIPAGRAALLLATMPLLTMLFAAALGRERLTASGAAGVALTVLGVALALGPGALAAGTGPHAWAGNLLVLAGAASGALCSIFYRPYVTRYPALQVSALAMLSSVVFLAAAAAAELAAGPWPRVTPAGWLAILFIGASSGIGYFLWLWALARTTPTRVTVFLALSPLTAALIGAIWLHEPLTVAFAGALALVTAGLWLSTRGGPGRLR